AAGSLWQDKGLPGVVGALGDHIDFFNGGGIGCQHRITVLVNPLLGGFFGYGRHGAAVGHFILTTAVAADHHKIFLHTPDGGCGVVAGDDDPGAGQVAATGVFGVAGYGIGAVGAGYGLGAVCDGITRLCPG